MIGDVIITNSVLGILVFLIALKMDKYEKESIASLLKVFFLMIILTFLFGLLKFEIVGDKKFSILVKAYIEAGFFEELLKFSILTFAILRYKGDVNESFDVVVYITAIAIGFALEENIGYFLKFASPGFQWMKLTGDSSLYNEQFNNILVSRIIPGHVLFDVIGVYFIGSTMKNLKKPRLFSILPALICAVILHGTWNYLIFLNSSLFHVYIFLLTIMVTLSVVSLSNQSIFKKMYIKYETLIENNIFLLQSIEINGFNPLALINQLKKIEKNLSFISYLKGKEQEHFVQLMDNIFPTPISKHIQENFQYVEHNLSVIEKELDKYKERKYDWSYYLGIIIAFTMVTFIAIFLIYIVDYIIFGK